MKLDGTQHFRLWLILLLIVSFGVILFNGSQESVDNSPASLYLTGSIITYTPFLLTSHSRFKDAFTLTLSQPGFLLISLYSLGVVVVSFTREDILSELPRALITAISIWSALMMGIGISCNRKILEIFVSTVLFYGVIVSFFSIFTGVGVISAVNSLAIGRTNRLWTTAFGVVDPVCMFASGLYLCINDFECNGSLKKKMYLIFTSLALLLILYSSTRSFLIQTFIILIFGILSRAKIKLRFIYVNMCIMVILIIGILINQADNLSDVALLNNFGFVDQNGKVGADSKRTILYEYLIDKALSSPFIGVGMNEVKDFSFTLPQGIAKTEYGYYLHIASFGFIVSSPFYIVMIIGGFIRPIFKLITLSQNAITKTFPLHGLAVGCFLAGFNGYYGQATSIAQFISLVFIGLSMRLDSQQIKCKKNAKVIV